MAMKWEAFPNLEMWRWKKSDNTAVIHYNSYTRTYDISLIRSIWNSGMGLSAFGFKSLEDAQAWASLITREE